MKGPLDGPPLPAEPAPRAAASAFVMFAAFLFVVLVTVLGHIVLALANSL